MISGLPTSAAYISGVVPVSSAVSSARPLLSARLTAATSFWRMALMSELSGAAKERIGTARVASSRTANILGIDLGCIEPSSMGLSGKAGAELQRKAG